MQPAARLHGRRQRRAGRGRQQVRSCHHTMACRHACQAKLAHPPSSTFKACGHSTTHFPAQSGGCPRQGRPTGPPALSASKRQWQRLNPRAGRGSAPAAWALAAWVPGAAAGAGPAEAAIAAAASEALLLLQRPSRSSWVVAARRAGPVMSVIAVAACCLLVAPPPSERGCARCCRSLHAAGCQPMGEKQQIVRMHVAECKGDFRACKQLGCMLHQPGSNASSRQAAKRAAAASVHRFLTGSI